MNIGSIKWFDNEKGYGFITGDYEDIFVHYSSIDQEGFKTLNEGQKVSYEVYKTNKGLQAKNVKEITKN